MLYAKATQAGKTIRCSDCYSDVKVPPPPKKKKKPQIDISTAATMPLEETTTRERKDPFQRSAAELLADAEATAEDDPEPDFSVPSFQGWLKDVFGVFFDPGVVLHWFILSVVASVPTALALGAESRFLILGLLIGSILFAALVVSCGFAIMISASNKEERVSDWPTGDPVAWMDQLWVALAAAALAAAPAFMLAQLMGGGLFGILLVMVAIYALFPFFILSMLDMNSILVPFSPEVARSMTRCQEAWGGFYFSAGLLFAGLYVLFLSLASSEGVAGAVICIFACVGVSFAYFAMLGRLAYSIGQVVNDPPREDQVDRSRPSES